MKISTRGRYALRFMIYLAQHSNGNFITLKDISEHEDISIKYLEQIASLLSKHDLLVSVRGPAGGYKLTKTAEKYSTLEILRVSEGDLAPVADDENVGTAGDKKSHSNTEHLWAGLRKVINEYLEGISLQDLVDQNVSEENYMYMI